MAEYISLSKTEFEEALKSLGTEYELINKPGAKEHVYKVKTSNEKVSVVIYSSVDIFSDKTRGVGEDAIRTVFWHEKGNHPIGKGKRIYRVTSKESIARRIATTIKEFMAKAPTISVMDWDYVKAVLRESSRSHKGEFAKSLLESLEKMGRLTETQLSYAIGEETPKGYPTMEARLKSSGWVYDPTFEEASESPAEDVEDSYPEDISDTGEEVQHRPNLVGQKYSIPVITDQSGMELLPTTGYPYKFEKFNPVQSMVFPFRDEDTNIVIGASTSAGKTICAELLMEETLKKKQRVIYLSPLKSLTQEKYDDWKTRFPNHPITILTGDYTLSEEKKAEIARSPIIVMTSEMADSRTRRMESEKNYWLKEVGLVIVDETHILSTSRGHAVESGIMRFTTINRKARILFLSATMPNVDQLGAWLQSLNGKPTRVIYSTWRPVQLQFHYLEYNPGYGAGSYRFVQEEKKRLAIQTIKSKPNEKFLVFCHDKATGNSIVRMLKEEGIDALFHNADLDLDERLEVESAFEKREGGLRVLVSTSTLAWGRNLPARNVIVVGIHRGLQEVDELDIIQMAGRAGRYGIDNEGHVYLIIPEGTTWDWQEIFRNPRPVTSVLKDHQVMAFHTLAEIQNRVITNSLTMLKWYQRSLAYFQGEEFNIDDAKGLLDDLEKMEMVINKETHYTLTGLGRVSGWLYYSPYDVYGWYKNFSKLFGGKDKEELIQCPHYNTCEEDTCPHTNKACTGYIPCKPMNKAGLNDLKQVAIAAATGGSVNSIFDKPLQASIVDDMSIAWALTDIPSNDWGYIPREVADEANELSWKLRNRGIQASDAIHVSLAAYKCLSGAEITGGTLKASSRAIKYDIRRVCQALGLIDSQYALWEKKGFWSILPTRVMYGIPEELLELVKLPGIGGVKAKKLWERGIKTLEDAATRTDILKTMFVPTMVSKVQKDARILIEKKKEGK